MATSKISTMVATSTKPSNTRPHRLRNAQTIYGFHLVWLDRHINEVNNEDCGNPILKLRQVVNIVHTFIDVDECMDFITDTKEGKTFMIVSDALSQTIVPIVQDISQVNSIYIFCESEVHYEKWAKEWTKVKGVYADMMSICEVLDQAAQEYDQNSLSISFIKPTDGALKDNLDQLDSSFMYTQILKEILLTINFEQKHIDEFLTYCREQFTSNSGELKNVDKIQKEYHQHQPIWWYTFDCCFYSMLNRALRSMEVDLIIKMGFFVRDLHQEIAALHFEQYNRQNHSDSFTVYRGQGLSQEDFDQLTKTKGGLMSFNNFLSTSLDRAVSFSFAQSNQDNPDLIGVLFEITINSSILSSPFANVRNASYYQGEEEILFSMHSVFRIGQVKQIDKNDRLWQVNLTLTSDNDPQLEVVTKSMQEETEGSTGWRRLGMLLIKIGQFNKAEELYEILLKQASDEDGKAYLFHHLGYVKENQGKYAEAIGFYENALKINQNTLPTNDANLSTSYNNIGLAYNSMGEYSKAFLYYEKALEIQQKTLPANHPLLGISYGNIGMVYHGMGEYPKALSYYEKACEIFQKTLPANHPDLATIYNNIGHVYYQMGEYSKAISSHEKALEIRKKTLPANHPDLAISYNNIGLVYDNIGEYSKALSYYEKALEIFQKTLAENYPGLATSYNNIGTVYENMGEHLKALSSHEKAFEIRKKTLPENHPDLATSYNNIGLAYDSIGEYSKAISYYEKALEIFSKTLSANHPDLASPYNNIGSVYYKMGEHSKALSSHEKALEIRQKTLPENHPDLAISYNNIGLVYDSMGEYSKALPYYERALGILQRSLPPQHPYLRSVKENIEILKKQL